MPIVVGTWLMTFPVWAQPVGTSATAAPPGPASPQLVPTAPDPGAQAFDRGLEALRGRRYGEAQPLLAEAVRLQPTPLRLYNLGLADRSLGRYVEAVDLFARYVAEPEAGADPARVAAVRTVVDDMRHALATLTLTLTPPGAAVQFDGRALTVPAVGVPIDPGAHVLEASAEGFAPERRELAAEPGSRLALRVTLQPRAGAWLVVEPSITSASVVIDGVREGAGAVERRLQAGSHTLEVRATGYDTVHRTVQLGTAGITRISVSLSRSGHPWVLPVAIAAGAVVVAGAVLTTVYLTRGTADPPAGTWATLYESIGVR